MRRLALVPLAAALACAIAAACSTFSDDDAPALDGSSADADAASSPDAIVDSPPDGAVGTTKRWLVVAGGNTKSPINPASLDEVLVAPILVDGTLGPWKPQPALPAARSQMASAALGRSIFLIGGTITPNLNAPTTDVLVADVSDDGVVSKWRSSTPFPRAGTDLVAATDGSRLLVLGESATPEVAAPVGDGIGAWSAGEALADVPYIPGLAIVRGHVYVMGSFPDGGGGTVRVAAFPALSGIVGPWSDGMTLPYETSTHTAAGIGGTLYVLGGLNINNGAREEVARATVHPDGGLSIWATVAPIPAPRSRACTVASGDYVYVIGGHAGSGESSAFDSVYFARANPGGTLSSWVETTKLPSGRHGVGCAAF